MNPPQLFANNSKNVHREHRAGLDLTITGTAACRHLDLTLRPVAGEALAEMFRRLAGILQEHDAIPVLQFGFGSLAQLDCASKALSDVFGTVDWPVTWVEGAPCDGKFVGLHVLAVSNRPVTRLRAGERVVGSIYEDGLARHCLLGGMGPETVNATRPEQTRQTLRLMEHLLEANGFAFSDLIRTWFYLHDILDWYNDFNVVRTEFYSRHRFRIGATPASTGVRGSNLAGAALALAAWAAQPINPLFHVQEVLSPLQCPAPAYGSSFSRAVEFNTPGCKRLLISGTASIEPGGKTVWVGDIRKQVQLTMEVVQAILKSRGMTWADAVRVAAYFKDPDFSSAYNAWCEENGVRLPALPMHCDICRDDLLFEIELDTALA